MAQKREKEETETELKVPAENLLCATSSIPTPPSLSVADKARSPERPDPPADLIFRSDLVVPPRPPRRTGAADAKRREVNRCSGCRRRVGLTGFRCRCGDLFCSEHRYSDRHDCNFDYKAAGREAIARENPVVRPAKILKV